MAQAPYVLLPGDGSMPIAYKEFYIAAKHRTPTGSYSALENMKY